MTTTTTDDQIAELRARRQSLALDALDDETAAAELGDVEREIAEHEQTLERAAHAQVERERRDAEQKARDDRERREAAHAHAVELQAERTKSAKAVDQAGRRLFDAVAKYARAARAQSDAFTEAGMRHAAASARTCAR